MASGGDFATILRPPLAEGGVPPEGIFHDGPQTARSRRQRRVRGRRDGPECREDGGDRDARGLDAGRIHGGPRAGPSRRPREPTCPRADVPAPNAGRRRALLAVILVGYFGVPLVLRALTTVSTDDAYVNGHVTFVAPRVAGQVVKVLVDDNDRVRKGDLLVQLDKRPYQVAVDAKQARTRRGKGQSHLGRRPGPRAGGAGSGQSLQAGTCHRGCEQPNRRSPRQRRRLANRPRPNWSAPKPIISRGLKLQKIAGRDQPGGSRSAQGGLSRSRSCRSI